MSLIVHLSISLYFPYSLHRNREFEKVNLKREFPIVLSDKALRHARKSLKGRGQKTFFETIICYCFLIFNSLVPDDVHRHHGLSSFLPLMTSQDVQSSMTCFLISSGIQSKKGL